MESLAKFQAVRQILKLVALAQLWLSRSIEKLSLCPCKLQSVDDLRPLCEHFTINEEDGNLEFLHCSFAFVTKAHVVYFGRSLSRKYDLTTEEANSCLTRVPDDDIYPEAPSHITKAPHSNGFFKGPMLTAYDDLRHTRQIAVMLLQEAEILERLMTRHHPNIIQYYGCKIARGRIVGLLLEEYPATLEDHLKQGLQDQDLASGFQGIERAVGHLHSFLLAHNDIKPSNIMIRADESWVLIDLGSCLPFGAALTSAGTSDWYEEGWTTSEKEHDEIALSKLWAWLKDTQFNM